MENPYNVGLDRNPANFQPLTPLGFLARTAANYPDAIAIIHGNIRVNYQTFYDRSRQLASQLANLGLGRGDTVSALLANTPAMLECHYGVPMAGAVLHSVNTRLEAATIAYQLAHAQAKVLIVDREFLSVAQAALAVANVSPLVIVYHDSEWAELSNVDTDDHYQDYDEFIAQGDRAFSWLMPEDEWDAISINYTSGTTGNPKGVVCHHRGAYLLALGNVFTADMPKYSTYLWTLPMFHCNGWCFPWTLSAICGTHVCLRQVRKEPIWLALHKHKVTHLCGAPIVMDIILSAENQTLTNKVAFFTAAAPPPERTLAQMQEAGFEVTHLYGLAEVYGPAVVNEWHQEWNLLPIEEQAKLKARQGVKYLPLENLDVLDPETMSAVPADGKTLGEVMFQGNVVMKGYFKNPTATQSAFEGGWFHSGDLAVKHPDGYIQLKDRSKDIIISGGENISSIEIEDVLYKHPAVAVTAVVSCPDEKWGEVPFAFVECGEGKTVSEQELKTWCGQHMAGFKVPKHFSFTPIPRTPTGKIQKFQLREQVSARLQSEESGSPKS
ncbi:acyl-CoA synthetase [Enterovibrio norvegicus]|uniref:acyl-CoA synthetase n=1 Tax=Enterovibrio norvegicus TaxID=188144 RepID=UPI0002F9A255|nr:acyl-CoA synthetase [Enterovibrio norvegicus]OEE43200.1 acyl-CoA synthetase [Enterovibrio norvegicus]